MSVRFIFGNTPDTMVASSSELRMGVSNIIPAATKPARGALQFYGNHEIGATVYIDFLETAGGPTRSAVLAPTRMLTANLCEYVATQMNAVATEDTLECFQTDIRRFRIRTTGSSGFLSLLWASGPNAANSAGDLLGYSARDRAGGVAYDARYTRNHTDEWIRAQFTDSSDQYRNAIGLAGLRASPAALLRLQANASADFGTPSFDVPLGNVHPRAHVAYFNIGATTGYEYWRLQIEDRRFPWPVQLFRFILGRFFEPSRGANTQYELFYEPAGRVLSKEQGGDYPSEGTGRPARHFRARWEKANALLPDDVEGLQAMSRDLSPGDPIFVDLRAPRWTGATASYPKDSANVLFGYVKEIEIEQVLADRFEAELDIVEEVLIPGLFM